MKPPVELVSQIKRQEGLRLEAYWDTVGQVWTIGYGHTPSFKGQIITEPEADDLLLADLEVAEADLLHALPWSADLPVPRYGVLWNMTFNMGVGGLLTFVRFLKDVKAGKWLYASREMIDSLWARQVGERAVELSEQMKTGEWQS